MISQKRFSTIITLHIYSCYTLTPTLTITRYDLLMILLRCYSTNRNAYNSEVRALYRGNYDINTISIRKLGETCETRHINGERVNYVHNEGKPFILPL